MEIDHNLMLLLNFDGGSTLDWFFWHVSGKLEWIPLYLFILWMLWKRYGWKKMLLALLFMGLAVVATDQIATLFKTCLPRLRPTHTPGISELLHTVNGYTGGKYGTVSAHAATTFSIAVFSLSIIRSHTYTILILLWTLTVSYSRIYLGVHFPLDILWGIMEGVVIALLALWCYNTLSLREIFKNK